VGQQQCPTHAARRDFGQPNKIEHRLFSQITLNWRGRPLTSHQIIVDLIGATRTTVRAELDTGT
jgi:Rhodopirellula transposase DDE domain